MSLHSHRLWWGKNCTLWLTLMLRRNTTGPVANLVDFVPLLQWLPNPMTARGKALHRELVRVLGAKIKHIAAILASGEPYPDCMAKYLLQHQEEEHLDDLDIIVMCSAFVIGGVETVSAPTLSSR